MLCWIKTAFVSYLALVLFYIPVVKTKQMLHEWIAVLGCLFHDRGKLGGYFFPNHNETVLVVFHSDAASLAHFPSHFLERNNKKGMVKPEMNKHMDWSPQTNYHRTSGLDGYQKDQVGWRGYLNPKSGSPAIILGSPPLFSLPSCSVLVENLPRIQVVQRDYLNPTLGSPTGPFSEFRSPGRWDSAICRVLELLWSPGHIFRILPNLVSVWHQ